MAVQIESIKDFLRRKLKEVGAARFDALAAETGVTPSFIRKFYYGSRENPRIETIQPLLDFFSEVERGARSLTDLDGVQVRTTEVASTEA